MTISTHKPIIACVQYWYSGNQFNYSYRVGEQEVQDFIEYHNEANTIASLITFTDESMMWDWIRSHDDDQLS